MTFAMRGNAKPFGKRLSPSAEMPNLLKSDLREARKQQNFKKVICGRPASIKSFKKLFVGDHIGAQETIETTIGIPLWIFLHQKDKLKNKIKQDHFK